MANTDGDGTNGRPLNQDTVALHSPKTLPVQNNLNKSPLFYGVSSSSSSTSATSSKIKISPQLGKQP